MLSDSRKSVEHQGFMVDLKSMWFNFYPDQVKGFLQHSEKQPHILLSLFFFPDEKLHRKIKSSWLPKLGCMVRPAMLLFSLEMMLLFSLEKWLVPRHNVVELLMEKMLT